MATSIDTQRHESGNDSISSHANHDASKPLLSVLSSQEQHDATSAHGSGDATVTPPLRYFKRSIVLLLIYLPFLIIPWAMTCILVVRPLDRPFYNDQSTGYHSDFVSLTHFWSRVVRTMNTIAAVLTIPITSALLAHGAAVYSQYRRPNQTLSLRQTLVVADRAWTSIPAIVRALNRSDGSGSAYLFFAAGLSILSALQSPLQQLLVTTETVNIMTCADNPIWNCDGGFNWNVFGYDPEPFMLAHAPQHSIVQATINKLVAFSNHDLQPFLWYDPMILNAVDAYSTEPANKLSNYFDKEGSKTPGGFYTTALPVDSRTGILRQHALRLNSTVQCFDIDRSAFPEHCPGPLPFSKTFFEDQGMSFRVCAPGNFSATAWTYSRDRQDISEEVYLDFHPYSRDLGHSQVLADNFTIHCVSNTTRGYFELASQHNNNTAGPLLHTWPEISALADFNDYLPYYEYANRIPKTIDEYDKYALPVWTDIAVDTDGVRYSEFVVPGPMMTAVIALFGNTSFLNQLDDAGDDKGISSVCQANNIPFIQTQAAQLYLTEIARTCGSVGDLPFSNLSANDTADLARIYREVVIGTWLMGFNDTSGDSRGSIDFYLDPEGMLATAMLFASEIWLTRTASMTDLTTARRISNSPGQPIVRPSAARYAILGISVLIGLEVLCLFGLVYFIYTVPRWTVSLDSLAVARLSHRLSDHDLPPLRPPEREDLDKLKHIDGLIGVDEDDVSQGMTTAIEEPLLRHKQVASSKGDLGQKIKTISSTHAGGSDTPFVTLARGGPGLIERRHAATRKQRKGTWSGSIKSWLTPGEIYNAEDITHRVAVTQQRPGQAHVKNLNSG